MARTFGHRCEKKFSFAESCQLQLHRQNCAAGMRNIRISNPSNWTSAPRADHIRVHFTCKLKHLAPAWKQRDNCIRAYARDRILPSRDRSGISGDCFSGKHIDRIEPGVYLSAETTHRRVRCHPPAILIGVTRMGEREREREREWDMRDR